MQPVALGIDIGGTKIAAALVSRSGQLFNVERVPTPIGGGASAVIRAVIEIAQKLWQTADTMQAEIIATGVGSAGLVDSQRGQIIYATDNLPGWSGMPIADRLGQGLPGPIMVENDVNAMAFGENRLGAGRGYNESLYVAVGTGLGGAVVRQGQLWNGTTWSAGEIGHLFIDRSGTRRCSCGQTGHLEAYTSGPAMVAQYAELAGLSIDLDLQGVARRATQGDPLARQAIQTGAHTLGLALGGLLDTLDPQALIIGGGVLGIGDLWWDALVAALRDNPLPGPAGIPILKAHLKNETVLLGAGLLAWERMKCEFECNF